MIDLNDVTIGELIIMHDKHGYAVVINNGRITDYIYESVNLT